MSRLRQHDHTLDGSEWDLSLLSLNEAPVEELKKNPRARKIDLSQNFMIKLPDSFTSLTHLIVLDLSKNRLQRLPDDFGNLTKLNRLDLYGNLLKTLPLTFGQLVKLRWLDLKQNPLEQPLAKTAGDCANQRQCEVCAINCVKFMRAEKLRVEVELRDRDVKMKQKLDYERRLQEKNLKEKERKKAKKARSTARKAQQKLDQDSEEDDEETDAKEMVDKRVGDKENDPNKRSLVGSVFSLCLSLIRFFSLIAVISLFIFMGASIGLHLQSGHKLETIDDIKVALSSSVKSVQNYQQFTKDLVLLIENIVKSVKNWRTTFSATNFGNVENQTKS